MPRVEKHISVAEANAAIYIDFEGFQDRAPALLGVLVEDDFEQIVLDPRLSAAAEAKELRCSNLKDEVARILRIGAEGRLVVAYSQHEQNVIRSYAGEDIAPVYRDARAIAKRWRNRLFRDRRRTGNGLKDFFPLIGYARGPHLGDRKSTKRLRAVGDMLAKRGAYARLTPTVKGQWTKLLDHNEHDCRGLKALMQRAARDLAETADTTVA